MKLKTIKNSLKLLLSLLIFFTLVGCSNTPSDTKYYKDVLKVNDSYYLVTEDLVNKNEVSKELGSISLQTPQSNQKYEYQNFEASKLDIGTKVYEIKNNKNTSVAVLVDNKYVIYKKISDKVTSDLFED